MTQPTGPIDEFGQAALSSTGHRVERAASAGRPREPYVLAVAPGSADDGQWRRGHADSSCLPGRAVFDQHWRDLTFLHWPVEPAAIAHLFPPGTAPDVINGVTYVGLVPFPMHHAGIAQLPVPYLGDFLETNVRLYSVDRSGHHGVLFRTLDAQRLATVLLARYGYGVPYTWAQMSSARYGDVVTYQSRRRWPAAGLTSRLRIRVGPRTQPTETEVWLTARWGLHSRIAGRTLWTPNYHEPWPLHAAEVLDLDDQLVVAAAIPLEAATMLRPLWSPGVHTQFGRPTRVA